MAPSSLPHQEDPNKISLECGRDAGTAEHIWLDVASSVQIYSNCVTSDKLLDGIPRNTSHRDLS